MPTKASSPRKNKGKVFFVAKSSGPRLGRLPLNTVNFVETRFARGTCLERAWDAQRGRKTSWLYVVVQFYP